MLNEEPAFLDAFICVSGVTLSLFLLELFALATFIIVTIKIIIRLCFFLRILNKLMSFILYWLHVIRELIHLLVLVGAGCLSYVGFVLGRVGQMVQELRNRRQILQEILSLILDGSILFFFNTGLMLGLFLCRTVRFFHLELLICYQIMQFLLGAGQGQKLLLHGQGCVVQLMDCDFILMVIIGRVIMVTNVGINWAWQFTVKSYSLYIWYECHSVIFLLFFVLFRSYVQPLSERLKHVIGTFDFFLSLGLIYLFTFLVLIMIRIYI